MLQFKTTNGTFLNIPGNEHEIFKELVVLAINYEVELLRRQRERLVLRLNNVIALKGE